MLLKLIRKWLYNLFWLMKSCFLSSNNILKVNITVIWPETPSNYHQSLHIIFCDLKIYPGIIVMLLKLISKWIWGLFNFGNMIFHQAITYLKVNKMMVWLETLAKHCKSLHRLDNSNTLNLIRKWIWSLLDLWKMIFHKATICWKWM